MYETGSVAYLECAKVGPGGPTPSGVQG